MKRLAIAVLALAIVLVSAPAALAAPGSATGFDQYGYNYRARIFVGAADGVDRVLDGKVWGDPTYANDHLVMKWSKAWDEARFNGAAWSPDAWTTNEWSGPQGSGSVWHYKIIWVGATLSASPYWRPGGYPIWGEFEVIMDQGVDPAFCSPQVHCWFALATPNGLGGP